MGGGNNPNPDTHAKAGCSNQPPWLGTTTSASTSASGFACQKERSTQRRRTRSPRRTLMRNPG
eukprot:779510-Karenia_brevis.AAC.1